MGRSNSCIQILVVLVNLTCMSLAQNANLSATFLATKLPTTLSAATPYYDGVSDTIYLLAGQRDGVVTGEILAFSIQDSSIQVASEMRQPGSAGSVAADEEGNIFHFGTLASAWGPTTVIQKFNPEANLTEIVSGHLPHGSRQSTAVRLNSSTILVIGGEGNVRGIVAFNTQDLTTRPVASLVTGSAPMTSIRVGNILHLFGWYYYKLNLETLESSFSSTVLPILYEDFHSTVWDGKHVYVTGGYAYGRYDETSLTNGILQYNPATERYSFLPVDNFPAKSKSEYFSRAPSAVFVPKLNRIYYFGGTLVTSLGIEDLDDIFYVDLGIL